MASWLVLLTYLSLEGSGMASEPGRAWNGHSELYPSSPDSKQILSCLTSWSIGGCCHCPCQRPEHTARLLGTARAEGSLTTLLDSAEGVARNRLVGLSPHGGPELDGRLSLCSRQAPALGGLWPLAAHRHRLLTTHHQRGLLTHSFYRGKLRHRTSW